MYPLRLEGLLIKEESTYGTDSVPTAGANGVRGTGRLWPALSSEFAFPNLREDVVSNSLVSVAPGLAYGQTMNIDWRVEVKGAGAAYSSVTPVRPEVDPFLRCCAMSRTHVDTVSSESVSYALADTGHVGATVYAYAGGKKFVVVGCKGNQTLEGSAGVISHIRFQLQGMLTSVTEASVPAITYSSVNPPAAVGLSLAIVPSGQSSWTPRVPGFELSTGHTIDRLDDFNSADGIEGFFIGDSKPRFSFTPRTKDLTTYDAWTYAQSRLVHTIDATIGTAQYNRLDIDIGLAYLMNQPQPAEDGNFAASRKEYMLRDLVLRFD
jgi:hypothetical protein